MKLVLHIGTEKTGTTSIQNWCSHNDAALLKRGIGYSSALGRPNNRKISVYARDSDKPDDGFIKYKINNKEQHEAFRRETEIRFHEEVTSFRERNCHTVLISNEHMHSRLVSDGMVSRLRKLFDGHFDEVEILCVLRPQAELMQSRLSVHARVGNLKPESLDTGKPLSYFDYLGLYQRWREHFPKISLIPFSRNKNIVGRLCNNLGVQIDDFEHVPRTNETLDFRAAALSYALAQSKFIGSEPNRNANIFLQDLPVEEPIKISRKTAEEINEKFYLGNRKLASLSGEVNLGDLQVDPETFPKRGNVEDIFSDWPASPFLRLSILRLNVQIWLERAATRCAEAERALLYQNVDNAKTFVTEAHACLKAAAQPDLEATRPMLKTLRRRLKTVESHLAPNNLQE